MCACVAFSANSLSEAVEKAERVTSGEMREMGEKDLFSTSPHMDENTDGENRIADFLQAFINLMRSSQKKKKKLAERLPAGGIQNLQSYKGSL